jgi:hypothetical protein
MSEDEQDDDQRAGSARQLCRLAPAHFSTNAVFLTLLCGWTNSRSASSCGAGLPDALLDAPHHDKPPIKMRNAVTAHGREPVSEDVSSSGVSWGFPTVTGSKSRVRIVAARRPASERCSLSAFLPAPDRGQPFGTSLSWGVPRTRSSPNITAAGDSIISPTPSSC